MAVVFVKEPVICLCTL